MLCACVVEGHRSCVVIATNKTPTCCRSKAMSAAVEAVDGQPAASEREQDVSAARRRRHRSARSASIRSGQSVSVEGGREMEGGEEDESSSVYSSSTASTSARLVHST